MAIHFTQAEAECLKSAARQALAPNYNARVRLDEAWLLKHRPHLEAALAKLGDTSAFTEAEASGEPKVIEKIVEVEVERIVEVEKIVEVERIVEVPAAPSPPPLAEPESDPDLE